MRRPGEPGYNESTVFVPEKFLKSLTGGQVSFLPPFFFFFCFVLVSF